MLTNPLVENTTGKTTSDNTDQTTVCLGKNISSTSHASLAYKELKCISSISLPMMLTGLILYSRSMISMIFLGRLGELSLAGGALAIGFANITGYSILSGLAMGMEPICGQAFGAKRFKLLGLVMQRTILLLLLVSIPIAFLWCNMKKILIFCGQEDEISSQAQLYILYSLPDLFAQCLLHPLRIYLRSQSITLPLTFCATLSIILHIPINYFLVSVLDLGIKGVALSGVWTNFNLVGSLIMYIMVSGVYNKTWGGITTECIKEWKPLLNLAIPSCISTTSLIYIFPSSLSFGVSTRVGNELGANQPNKAKLATIVGLGSSFTLGFSALLFAIMVRNVWAKMFTLDADIIALTSMVLPIIGLCELGNCPQTTGCGVLRGTARPKLGANINLGCFYLVGMPVALWLGFYAGLDFRGLWLGLLAAQGSCVVTMFIIISRTDWDHQAQRAQELTGSTNVADPAEDETVLVDDQSKANLKQNDNVKNDSPFNLV
ncbi:hypothetical protein ACET3Z_004508 [Daucus carota]